MQKPAIELINLLREKSLTIGTVESATGGLIANYLTDVPGSSAVFKGSIVAYSNEIKINVVGVKAGTIQQHGAVSSQTAAEMAERGKTLLGVDICVSDTGIAGPGGATDGKPVGLFYLGLALPGRVETGKHILSGDREQNKIKAAIIVLEWVNKSLVEKE